MRDLQEILDQVRGRCTGPQTPIRRPGLPDLTLVTSTSLTEPIHYISEPAVALTLQGEKRLLLGTQEHRYGAGQYLIVSVNLPIASHVVKASTSKPFVAVAITLKPSLIASLLLEAGTAVVRAPAITGVGVSNASHDLLDTVGRVIRLLDRPADQPILGPLVERELVWHLLRGGQGSLVQQIGLAGGHLSRVNCALQWIRDHYDETLHIDQVARAAAMSVTSLHRHFRAVTLMSPLQYQKQIRLQEARRRLINSDKGMAGIGFEVGYDSPSQFNREYRRYFGMSPGQDAKRLREMLTA